MEDRFWAADTLVFWSLQMADLAGVDAWLDIMEDCIPHIKEHATEEYALTMKKMLVAGARDRPGQMRRYYSQANSTQSITSEKRRILKYNYAHCLFKLDEYEEAEELVYDLIEEYYDLLGVRPGDVLFRKAIEIIPRLSAKSSIDDAKHLADTLDLAAQVVNAQNRHSGMCRIHACKFYSIADAISSAVRVGQDFVDESLERGDLLSAREMFETMLLPLVRERKMLGRWVDVHSHYAVVLAYDGELEQARTLIGSLEPMIGEDDELREQVVRQKAIIEAIANHEVELRVPHTHELRASRTLANPATPSKIGRNEPCPCGSGRKYKKCCGK
jgi:hypothetical protein